MKAVKDAGKVPMLLLLTVGNRAIGLLEFIGNIGFLLSDVARSARQGLFGKRGRRMGWQNLWAQMVRVALDGAHGDLLLSA